MPYISFSNPCDTRDTWRLMFQSAILAPAYHGDLRVFFMPCILFFNPRDTRDTWRFCSGL